MTTQRFQAVLSTLAIACCVAAARAQTPPRYTVELLGPATGATAINDSAVMIVTQPLAPASERGFVAGPGSPLSPLPLPLGATSSRVYDINEAGVICGAVSSQTYADPSFGAIAAIWIPDGGGGYAIQELGKLPGDIGSAATALNDVGDVVGYSQGGMFRRAVWLTAPGGVLDLTFTGAFDPKAINDQRVIVCYETHCSRLDLDTMVLEDLGVPAGSFWNTSGIAINESNQVAGLAILATSTSCDRDAARFTDGVGWEIFSGCGPINGCGSINDLGDVTMWVNTAAYVRFEGLGSFRIEDLIDAPVGHWFLFTGSARINDARQIAVGGSNSVTGESGLLLLTPISAAGVAACFGDGSGTPCPCGNNGASGNGCASSVHPSGASLAGSGVASIAGDTLVLSGAGMPNAPALYFQGTTMQSGGAGSTFGDGLRCAAGTVIRLGTKTSSGGASQYPGAGDPSISTRGLVTSPGLRTYQVWYRNAASFCTPSTFNLTNGWEVSWTI